MESRRFLIVLVVISMALVSYSQAHKFLVGGKDGWVVNPSENFNHWAERHRFQVSDTLFFRYKKGSNSVMVVTKEDYYSCINKNPIQSLTDGDSVFKFERSGPFFFISGNADDCQNGQKLIVVVLALRHKYDRGTTPLVPSSSPVASPNSGSNPSELDKPPTPPLKKNSGSMLSFRGSDVWLVLCVSIGMSMILSV
ncbi:PREDICTED: early nodulin-like protein 1 [Fragaria vesca subsp. vesca]|uniref:early nodulin-like protein 1 n=1 Tax=Fragaria vesca subsp. vesca TaxID=101020 RepID=UPI0002C30A7A|nr:PREDICTED: early nodulin-like protein 1 [Fragaria vesca subsp. vesca]